MRFSSEQASRKPRAACKATAQRAGPTKEEWERHRSQITRLYLDENMKLKEVMTIMKEHGLKAT
jgi:hypothetical protein